ncbi:hypothetical protein FQA39_LY08131 [Lamprigera yunnana]|nr:hypothetical protein FQA39_LY08131 [Lamprigera yunnana]
MMFIIWCVIYSAAAFGAHCMVLQISNTNNYEDCLLGVISQNFKEDETLHFVTTESYDIMPFEKFFNPYVVVDINKPIQLKLKTARNFIILTKNEDSLEKLLTTLRNSTVWSETQSARGKFIIITFTNTPSNIFYTMWSYKIIDVVVLLPSSTNVYTLYVANPFENGNDCGNAPVTITEQSCSAPFIKTVKTPIKNLGGCKFYFVPSFQALDLFNRTIMFLLTELVNTLNGTLSLDDKHNLSEVEYSIAFSAYFYYPGPLYDNSKVIYQIDWIWVAPSPIRDFPIETITMFFQIEVWLLTGFMFVFTVVVWWFATVLKTSSKFSQFSHVIIIVTSLTLCGTVNSIPKTKILRYMFIIYSVYVVLIQTAFKTNLVYGLTGYRGIATNAKQVLELDLPLCCSKGDEYRYMASHSADSNTIHKFNKLITKCDCYPFCLNVIHDYRNMTLFVPTDYYKSLFRDEEKHLQAFFDNSIHNSLKFAFLIKRGHYFIENLNSIIITLEESGIFEKQIKKFQPTIKEYVMDETAIALNIVHMSFAFILLMAIAGKLQVVARDNFGDTLLNGTLCCQVEETPESTCFERRSQQQEESTKHRGASFGNVKSAFTT